MWHRKPSAAGAYYPSNPDQLKRDIDRYLNNAQKRDLKGELLGIICPHAGYIYSGPIAAYSYKQLLGSEIDLAIVMAPSHRTRFAGASVIDSGIYETPLGNVEIDKSIGQTLLNKTHFSFIKEAHIAEHSLEVQVPFLQHVLKNFKIVPIVIGSYDIISFRAIADELYDCIKHEKRKLIMVLSTDLSHYHPYEAANAIDGKYAEILKSLDEEKLDNAIAGSKAEACGHGPVSIGLIVSKKMGAKNIDILHYANSGDTSGSKSEVVGYLSAAITK